MHERLRGASETSQFVHNGTFIRPLNSEKSSLENSDTWNLKEPVEADRNGKMMTKPSWIE